MEGKELQRQAEVRWAMKLSISSIHPPSCHLTSNRFLHRVLVFLHRDRALHTDMYRGKAWGVVIDLFHRTVVPPKVLLPPLLRNLAERMRRLPALSKFIPNEANALDYRRGVHVLYAHADDR